MKKSKLTKNQFRKMIQEEISNLTDLVLEEEGDVAADDEEEGEEEESEDAAMAKGDAAQPPEDNNDMSKLQTEKKITREVLRKMLQEEFENIMSEDEYEDANNPLAGEAPEEDESAAIIRDLEMLHRKLEGNPLQEELAVIIARLKELPGAPLGTDIAMAYRPARDPEF